jgi:hypothetical protein
MNNYQKSLLQPHPLMGAFTTSIAQVILGIHFVADASLPFAIRWALFAATPCGVISLVAYVQEIVKAEDASFRPSFRGTLWLWFGVLWMFVLMALGLIHVGPISFP